MGRGRQKAKQQKIARKLKYLTTDTDYDELAKELNHQESGSGSVDPFADVDTQYESRYTDKSADRAPASVSSAPSDDLDDYAKWAAEAAAKATSGEMPATSPAPKPRKPMPMPVPSALKRKKS